MFMVYKKLTAKEISKDVKGVVRKLTKWFKDNPTRQTCHAALWYDDDADIRRAHISEDVKTAAEKACKEHK